MGIILLPFIFDALCIGIYSLIQSIKHIRKKQINLTEIILGLVVSLVLFGLVCLSYIIEGDIWALSPMMRIPIYLLIIPFALHVLTKRSKKPILVKLSKVLLINVVFSALLGIVYGGLIFEITAYFGLTPSLISIRE
jgi:hypothetical protein